MSRSQGLFEEFFRGQTYGLRDDYEPRVWHTQCFEAFNNSVTDWLSSEAEGQHRFCIDAGTGSGKTQAAGHIASFMQNRKLVDQIVFVCPNKSIRRRAAKVFRDLFGIDMSVFHARKHKDGVPRTKQGYILTYGHLFDDPTLHRRICSPETLVIFDEIHHLGDSSGWGDAALEAFGRVRFILGLTGTPFRSDGVLIPFVTYEERKDEGVARFLAEAPNGFTYPLGKAIAEGICREPLFQFHDATVELRLPGEAGELKVTFKDTDVSAAVSSLRLRHAVRYPSVGRSQMLRTALDRVRAEGRKAIIFLGGDTEGDHTPTADAMEFLPQELREMGITDDDFEAVTGEDPEAQAKIENFGASKKWILISINMISEGTDIPELSAAIFLTSITAKQTTLQRIGRVLRLLGEDDPFKAALIFMFEDPNLVELAMEIKDEIRREIKLRQERAKVDGTDAGSPRKRAEGYCIDGGNPTVVVFGGRTYPAEIVERARQRCRETGLPMTMLHAVIDVLMRDTYGDGSERVA